MEAKNIKKKDSISLPVTQFISMYKIVHYWAINKPVWSQQRHVADFSQK